MNRHLLFFAFLAALLPGASAWAQEVGFTNRATELKAEPKIDSPTLAQLAKDASIKVFLRQSGWAQIEADKRIGWVRTFHLRFQGAVSTTGESTSSGFFSWFSSDRKRAAGPTSTIGVRGGDEVEELGKSTPSPAEFSKMKSYALSKNEGDAFGKRNKLAQNRIAYVSEDGRPLGGGK